MKKMFLIPFACLLLALSIAAQTGDTPEQKNALAEIGTLNGQVIALFKQKNYDEALKVALNVWSLAEKNGLAKDVRVLPSLTNLGEIYLAKGRETEAVATFQKIFDAYEARSAATGLPAVRLTERLATVYFVKKDYGRAEDFFLKALAAREKLNGPVSKEAANLNNALADTYRLKNNYQKADEFYVKAIEINDKILSEDEKKNREDVSNYECFLYHKALSENRVKDIYKEITAFKAARKTPGSSEKFVESGIVNGKATNLVKPAYPMNMRGNSGFVMVRVTIDEQGKVISAKATCGILGFVEAVEEAARKSKFSPTLISGQPVKVTGVIVYNFIR